MNTRFYRRNGTPISRAKVRAARLAMVEAKRTGKRPDGLPCSVQPELAASFERMREEDFADYSGAYTFRKI